MLKKKLSRFIFVMFPHLLIIEDGSIISDRYVNYQCTLTDVVDRLSK
ncbi:MAG: hypothetical protein Q8S15_05930 [Erysipelotrichaceae bacterium]|jgi:hypothetical protein|nr:hypothetical protein [Erysipelotrichaceae bacterium]MDP3305587.1 hypothetical protein [Erysipelotrichaceae bacterium]